MERAYNPHQSGSTEKQGKSILSYLAQKNGRKMEELSDEILSLQNEIDKLKDEIEVLESTSQPEHFMEFAMEHSRRTAENLHEMIHLEFAEIDEEANRIRDNHKHKIMELDAKMQKGIQYAYKIMNNMMEQPAPEAPAAHPAKEASVKSEETIPKRQPVQEKQPAVTEKQPALETDDVKIIEGFWDEPKPEEKSQMETSISEKEKDKDKEKDKEKEQGKANVTGLKNMYIIGKVAGEDLFDNSGKLIIAKNEVITEEIIDKAEKVGNLIELVLEMKLQEG